MILDYFQKNYPNVSNLSNITWSHAVNSQDRLKKFFHDPETMFLEFDISISTAGLAVAAHPPTHESDLSFDELLDLTAHTKQGLKFDFKDPEVLVECLQKLKSANFSQPIVLNADILLGTNAPRPKFVAEAFVSLCKKYLPNSVLSLGWTTTALDPYTDEQVTQMLELIKDTSGEITFPIRAALLPHSLPLLQRLIQTNPVYSLTVWNNEEFDTNWIRNNLDKDRTFIDLIDLSDGPTHFDALRDFNK